MSPNSSRCIRRVRRQQPFLLVSIPQLYVQRHSRGYVDPSLWDDGVTALFSNYQANFTRNTNFGQNSDYRYLGLRNGFNLFGWRLRNDSS